MNRLQSTIFWTAIICLTFLLGCQPITAPENASTTSQPTPTTIPEANTDSITITILNTADEHGWLQPFSPFRSGKTVGGAANIYAWWQEEEQLNPDSFLTLSGGDNWTGPSISTWFEGEPMVEVFNQMGYHAAAIGNHEFDFGRDVMAQRFAEAEYVYLGANIRDSETGELADFAQPYALFEVSGVTVGVLGLATTATATTTHPKNIGDLAFAPYEEALDEYLPQMRAEGADIMVILSHVCLNDLIQLAATEPDVHAMFAGHCNILNAQMVKGISVMGSGAQFAGYARLDITYDPVADAVIDMDQRTVSVSYVTDEGNPVTPDAAIAKMVDGWQVLVDEQLSKTIGYTKNGLVRRSHEMANLVTDAWLWAYPAADIAVSNWGGFRAHLPAGDISWGTVIDVLPFDNNLTTVTITGAQLAENLRCCGGAVSGISYDVRGGDVDITMSDGSAFDPAATYTVIISDFMYAGGDNYLFGAQDEVGYDTNIHWRQPVIDYILSLETSEEQPLDVFLDNMARVR
ncbi:MAG: bifunctional UDP-sugar hydrolase/5'-nucleotidase [Chloroflexota bacterium]